MESMVANLARRYFDEHKNEFGSESSFLGFQRIGYPLTVSVSELNYCLVVGSIEYAKKKFKSPSSSTKLLVKYLETSNLQLSLRWGFALLNQELNFFDEVLPVFNHMGPTKDLFVELCTKSTLVTPTSGQIAILYKYPPGNIHIYKKRRATTISVEQCSLMLKKIAQFHARSLQLKKANPRRFEQMNSNPQPAPYNLHLVLPFLTGCLSQLKWDERLKPFSPLTEGISRLNQMLLNVETFADRLRVPFVRALASDHCWVMCHQNYGQQSVIFQRAMNGKPADMKIYNCQSMGFASLALDVVIPLFVELPESSRSTHLNLFLRDYQAELVETCVDFINVPIVQFIKDELKKSVPFALYTLASRIIQAEAQPQNSLFSPDVWTRNRMVNLCKYLILNGFI